MNPDESARQVFKKLAPGLLPALVSDLPPWGKVIVLGALGVGMGSGVGLATVVKLMGIQTVSAAAADKAEVVGKIGAVVEQLQIANATGAVHHAEILLAIKKVERAGQDQAANLQTLRRQIAKKVALPPAPTPAPAPPSPPAKEGPAP